MLLVPLPRQTKCRRGSEGGRPRDVHIRAESLPGFLRSAWRLHKRADFNRCGGGARGLPSPEERSIEVGYLHNCDAADLLLAFYKRPVGQYYVAIVVAENGRRIGGMQSATENPHAGRLHFPAQRHHVAPNLLKYLRRRRCAAGGITDTQQILLHGQLLY